MAQDAETPAQDAAPPAPDRRSTWAALRPLVLRLHFYAGVFIAPFILVAAVSGLLYVWTPQIDQALFADQLHVEPSETSLQLSEQIRIAERELPDAELDAVRPATTDEDSTRVLFNVPEFEGSHRMTVFVDPHRGEVLGVMDTYGTSGALPVRTWTDMLHRNLHLGDVGRLYSELAASWMWLVALGGVGLWVSRKWRSGGSGTSAGPGASADPGTPSVPARPVGRARRLLIPGAGTSRGRSRSMSVHGATGLWLAVGLLFLSATGMTWSQYAGANIGELRERLSWSTPAVSTEAPAAPSDAGGGADAGAGEGSDAGVDAVLASAREAGLDGPVEVVLPDENASAYVVDQVDRSWPTRVDSVSVSAETAEVTDVVRFENYPLMAKLTRWGIDAHMGVLFGVPNQLLLTAVAGGLITVIVMGYRMWWQRRPTHAGALGMGRPYPRGSFRALPLPYKAAVAALLALIGFAVPLLGASLLLFLAVDVLLGRRTRAKSRGPRAAGPGAPREAAGEPEDAVSPPASRPGSARQ